jgi:hypothetical protein
MGLRTEVLALDDGLLRGRPPRRRPGFQWSEEVDDILRRADFLGGWLGLAGDPTGLYGLLRVRP